MAYVLLWIESLAAGLLLVAAALAVFSRMERRRLAWIFLIAAIGIPLSVGLLETAGSILLKKSLLEHTWLGYTLSWTLALIGGIAWILRVGLKRADGVRTAAAWPRLHLNLGWIAALALHLITFWNLDSTMRLRLSSVRMEAGAMALAAAPPRVPDPDNAAFIYERAAETTQRLEKSLQERSVNTASWYNKLGKVDFNASEPLLREYLRQLQPTLAQVRGATAMSGCYFEHEYAQPSIDMTLPELSHMRQLARNLAADARIKAADGKIRDAFENIKAMRRMANHVTAEPILISGLVAIAIDTLASDTLEGILTSCKPSAEDLATLPPDDNFTNRRALRRCLIGEEAFGLSAFAMLGGETDTDNLMQLSGLNSDMAMPIVGPIWRVFLMSDDLAAYRSQMKDMRRLTDQDRSYAIGNVDAIEEAAKSRRAGLLSGMILPALSHSFKAFLNAQARHRLADLALAVTAYRAKTGKYPAQAQDLVPDFIGDIPTDPYDNKPLRLLPAADGVTLYSIGQDLKDGGGTTHDIEKGDILFRVGSVAPAAEKKPGSF